MDPEQLLGKQREDLVSPFDGRDPVASNIFLQSEVLRLFFVPQSIKIDVVEGDLPRVFVDKGEGGTRDVIRPLDANPCGQPFDELCLPCSKFADETNDRPGRKKPPEDLAGSSRLRCASGLKDP